LALNTQDIKENQKVFLVKKKKNLEPVNLRNRVNLHYNQVA